MENLYKLTKEQLIVECKRLQRENEILKCELDDLSECYSDLEDQLLHAINNSSERG